MANVKIRINKYIAIIFLLCALCIDFFYLIDGNISLASIKYEDVVFLLVFAFEAYIFVKFYRKKNKYLFEYECLFVLVLVLVSGIMGMISYGQPFMLGIRANRHWLIWILLYYPITKLIYEKRITTDKLERMLSVFCLIFLIIATIQYLLGESVIFTTTTVDFRYGQYRFYFENPILMLFAGICLNKYIREKNKTSLFIVAWIVFFYIVVTKGRMNTLVILASIAFFLVFFSKLAPMKKIFVYLLIIGVICIVLNSEIGQQIMDAIFGKSVDSSTGIREIGRAFYITEIFSDVRFTLFGHGVINTQWENALVVSRFAENISVADNGLIGLCYYYGLIGMAWFILILIKCLKESYKYFKRTGNFAYLFFAIANTIGSFTLWPSCFEPTFTFALYAAMLSGIKNIGVVNNKND